MPFIIILAGIAAAHKHAADRAVDVQRQQYALEVAKFNAEHHTNIQPTKKGIIVYDSKTNTVSNQDINDVYHKAGHNKMTQSQSNPPQPVSKLRKN